MLVTCRECAAEISNTATACPKCGAPASIAFAKPAEPKQGTSSSPETPVRIQPRPGFAQGGLGKAAAIILLIYALLAALGNIMNWFDEAYSHQSVAYRTGQGIAMAALVGGAWRGIMRREKRTWVDWIVVAFLLFVALATLVAAVNAMTTLGIERLDAPTSIVFALMILQVLISVIVAIRLLRQPYQPPKQTLQAIFE